MRYNLASPSFSLITNNRKFALEHFHVSTTGPCLLFSNGDHLYFAEMEPGVEPLRAKPFNIPFQNSRNIVGACHGFLCMLSKALVYSSGDSLSVGAEEWTSNDDDMVEIVLCNPLTREFQQLPPDPGDLTLILSVGFGYDPKAQIYKVVKLSSKGDPSIDKLDRIEIKLMRVGANAEWIEVHPVSDIGRSIKEGKVIPQDGEAVWVNGRLHWLVTERRCFRSDNASFILAFLVGEEEFEEITCPNYPLSQECNQLILFNGNLAVVIHDKSELQTWVLRDYNMHQATWERIFTIPNFAQLARAHGLLSHIEFEYMNGLSYGPRVLTTVGNKQYLWFGSGSVYCYNMDTLGLEIVKHRCDSRSIVSRIENGISPHSQLHTDVVLHFLGQNSKLVYLLCALVSFLNS